MSFDFVVQIVSIALLTSSEIATAAPPVESTWGHNWTTAAAAWWGDFGYSLLSSDEAKFVADHYFLASLEKCTGKGQGVPTEQGIYQTAAQIKSFNPSVKTTFYWHTGQAGIGCYDANKEFLSHPEWFLRDDNGNIVGHKDSTHPAGSPRIDYTNRNATGWWVSVPLRGFNTTSSEDAVKLIDGVLADGSGFENIPNISAGRLQTLYTAKLAMIQRLQEAFDKVERGGVVFGNGLCEYDQNPLDPHNRRILDYVRGVQNEHYAAFEQVYPNGTLNLDKVSDTLDNIEWAASFDNGTKQVFCSYWAGPYTGFSSDPGLAKGWPKYFDDSQPCGKNSPQGLNCTQVQHMDGWRDELIRWLPFNLASYLIVAEKNTWFTQAVWYADYQGFVPCINAPETCTLDPSFYADYLKKPLGAPQEKRRQIGAYKWERKFQHATVTLDLSNPLDGTSIDFHALAL